MGGKGGYERRIEVILKMQKKSRGAFGGEGVGQGGGPVWGRTGWGSTVDVNEELKLLSKYKKQIGGWGWGSLIRFARTSSHVTDFNKCNKFLTVKHLKQGYLYHKLRKAFSKFYRRHFELIEKYHVSQKKLMQQGICNPEFYGDLVYTCKFKKIIGNPNFHFVSFEMYSKSFQESRVFFRHYVADCMPSF